MASSWWVVTYVAQGSGAAQLGTVIVQAASASAARTLAASKLPDYDQVGAARGPYPTQAAAADAGISTSGSGSGTVTPVSGTGGNNASPPSGSGQLPATPSNLSPGATGTCLIQLPSIVGGGCLFTKTNARAFIAAGLLALGAAIAVTGIVLLAAQSKVGGQVISSASPAGRIAKLAG